MFLLFYCLDCYPVNLQSIPIFTKTPLTTFICYAVVPSMIYQIGLYLTEDVFNRIILSQFGVLGFLNILCIIHGSSHGNIPEYYGILLSFILGYSYSGFKKHHLYHHKHTATTKDIDIGPIGMTLIPPKWMKIIRSKLILLPLNMLHSLMFTKLDTIVVLFIHIYLSITFFNVWFWRFAVPYYGYSIIAIHLNELQHTHPNIKWVDDNCVRYSARDITHNITRAPLFFAFVLPGITDSHSLHHMDTSIPDYNLRNHSKYKYAQLHNLQCNNLYDFFVKIHYNRNKTLKWDYKTNNYLEY
jgi:fatty acid desaturase